MSKSSKRPATLHTIARHAGVSIGTVDRVINNRGRVAAATQERVKAAIEALGYTRNAMASSLSRATPVRFTVLMPAAYEDAGYWQLPLQGIHAASREIAPYHVTVSFRQYEVMSSSSCRRSITTALDEGCDGFLIAPSGITDHALFAELIPPEIPCVFFDSYVENMRSITRIGQDPELSGVLSARLMSLVVKGQGPILTLVPMTGPSHIKERVASFCTASVRFGLPQIEITLFNPKDSASSLNQLCLDLLSREKGGFSGISVTNALAAPFTHAVRAWEADHQARDRVPIIGFDLLPENCDLLRTGKIDFLLSQRPFEQGYVGLISLFKHVVLHEVIPHVTLLPLDIVTPENVDAMQNDTSVIHVRNGHASDPS